MLHIHKTVPALPQIELLISLSFGADPILMKKFYDRLIAMFADVQIIYNNYNSANFQDGPTQDISRLQQANLALTFSNGIIQIDQSAFKNACGANFSSLCVDSLKNLFDQLPNAIVRYMDSSEQTVDGQVWGSLYLNVEQQTRQYIGFLLRSYFNIAYVIGI